LENIIIPADGRLFLPDNWTTRGTVALALYNLANYGIHFDADPENSQNYGSAPGPHQEFSDVPKNSQYYMSVSYCASKGYVSGYPNSVFKPEGFITRAEMCAILCRFLLLPEDSSASLPSDVPSGHWAEGSISAVISKRIMSGYEDSTFRLGNKLTRAELAAIIVSAVQLQQSGNDPEFLDVPKTHWAYKSIACVSSPSIREPSPYEAEVAELTNAARAKVGAKALTLDPLLCDIARMKVYDMINNNYFDHKSPKWDYPEVMMGTLGVGFSYQGENIANGFRTPADVTKAWINSPPHYKNIILKEFSKFGIAYAKSEDGTAFWVQEFID
jgi:uncharacterized protein YkwD